MDRMTSAVTDLALRYQAAGYFPSASIRIFNHEKTLATVCVGDAREDSLFDVASLTKMATATRILLWVAEGRLTLDATLPSLWPEIEADSYLNQRLGHITLHQLLTHTSSITPWYPFYSRRGENFWVIFRDVLKTTEVVEGMAYSDLNFMLLGLLWERMSNAPLEACLQRDLVEPLGLGQMIYHPNANLDIIPSCYDNAIEQEMCAEGQIYFADFRPMNTPVRGSVNDGNAHYFFEDAAGHAGIFADTLAYARLCQFYMNSTLPIFKAAQLEQPHAPTRGLGLQTGPIYPHGCGHTGFTGTSLYFSSEYDIGVVAFTNRLFYPNESATSTNDFRRALHETVFALR